MNTVLRALWGKVNGIGITNPSEVTSLLRDLNRRLSTLETAYEELASHRPAPDSEAGRDIPSVDPGNDGGRAEPQARSKGSAPRRSK